MRWMLQAAGVTATGPRGELQVRGLLAVWLWAIRAWERDTSDDLSGTMAAIDAALGRAERVANWLHGQRRPPPAAVAEAEASPDPPGPEDVPTPATDAPQDEP